MSGAFNNDGRGISPLIATSWERCNKLMKRETWNVPHQAQGVTFASIYRRKKAMLTLGQAALEDAWEYMAPRECALLILDETACILSRNGDPQTLQQLSVLGFNDGTYCAEGIIGTCALSLAAISGQAVKTMADQHFKQALWNWAFCATPLFDSKGRLTGTIALACPVEQTTAADLPLTLAIAREVGNLLLTDSLLAETNSHLNQLNALLESMDDGVISWDEQGNLQFINAQAARVLRLDATASQGRAITELLTLPAVLQIQPQYGVPYGVTLNPFLSPFGLPCKQPAWGYISALDLKTNEVVWKKRIGTPQDSMPFPMPVPVPFNMGMPMLGGPISTAGNVLFIAATADNYLRAYNMSNGEKLWQGRLPAGGQATPMTYEVNGKQYVVISAGGHGSFGTKMGDYIVAYALPDDVK